MNVQTRLTPVAERDHSLFTAEEFEAMIGMGAFQDMRAELVRGRIERMAPAYGAHGRSNADLLVKLANVLRQHVFAVDLAVRVDPLTVRGLDIAVGPDGFEERGLTSLDSLLLGVEIADTTLARDLGEKAGEFAGAGLANYWVVDLRARAVHVMREPVDGQYEKVEVVRFGEELAVPGTERTIVLP